MARWIRKSAGIACFASIIVRSVDGDEQIMPKGRIGNGQIVRNVEGTIVTPGRSAGNDADRDVDVENPRPADVVGDPAPHDGAHDRSHHNGNRPK